MLKNERLQLRAVEPEDLDLMYLVENDTELWAYGNTTVPYSHYALRQFIEQHTANIYQDGMLRLAISTPDGETIGFIDLYRIDFQHARAEVGLVLLAPWQHRGLAREALALLCTYAHAHLRLHTLYAVVCVENLPALRLFERSGFGISGTLKDWLNQDGTYKSAHVLTRCLEE